MTSLMRPAEEGNFRLFQGQQKHNERAFLDNISRTIAGASVEEREFGKNPKPRQHHLSV